MGDKLHRLLAEFKGQGGQGTTGPNGSLSRQIHTANPTPLLDLDVFDIPVGLDLKTDHGLNASLQLAQRGFQPVLSDPLLDLADVPGVHRTLAGTRTDADALTSSKAASRAWIGATGSTTAGLRRLGDSPRTGSLGRGRWRSPLGGTLLFKDLFTHGRGLFDRLGRCRLRTRDNRGLVHPGTPVEFIGEPDRHEIPPLSAARPGSDHDRIAGRKQIHGKNEHQKQGGMTHHGSYKGHPVSFLADM